MIAPAKRVLFWFTRDLRLHDNAALLWAAQRAERLICVYCIDPAWFRLNNFGSSRLGRHRRRFLAETLGSLDKSLQALGQQLLVVRGAPCATITKLIDRYGIGAVVRSQHNGVYESRQWQILQQKHPALVFKELPTYTLFNPEQLSTLHRLPATFTAFRKQLEPIAPSQPADPPGYLPPPLPVGTASIDAAIEGLQICDCGQSPFKGGEARGLQHLQSYFAGASPQTYKQTRDQLQGWEQSTKFSPWLADGSLSVRQVSAELQRYETRHGANESTYWIYFELLWREYFQWYAQHHGSGLFRSRGIGRRKPLTTFYPQRFKQWCKGQTPWPLINACMAQLNQTGYLSNRGRQLAASCLVNELSVDWRCGAAYFEQQLIDYDMAANWGNWQYIAGVGADPRGGRHFNIDKQTRLYDADGAFVERWTTPAASYPLDSVDAADWPISPPSPESETGP